MPVATTCGVLFWFHHSFGGGRDKPTRATLAHVAAHHAATRRANVMLPAHNKQKGSQHVSKQLTFVILAGLVIGALAWIDPIFIPLVLGGPIVTGAVAASRGIRLTWVALAWAIAGVSMILSDWVINHEDVAFHAALTFVMPALAAAAWAATGRLTGRRHLTTDA